MGSKIYKCSCRNQNGKCENYSGENRMKFTKMKLKTFIHYGTMKPTKLNNKNKKVKNQLVSLAWRNKKIWALFTELNVNQEWHSAGWRPGCCVWTGMFSVLQQERILSSTDDIWQHSSWVSEHTVVTNTKRRKGSTISFVLLSRAYAQDQHRRFKQSNYLEGKHFQLVARSQYNLPTRI